MKILAIGRNYADHISELKNETPEAPVIFSKPETAILKKNEPFYYPEFSSDIHHEVEITVKISKIGKNIEPRFASKYYDEIGLGIDFTARDLQTYQKSKGLPWEIAKAFDASAPISDFVNKADFDLKNLDFSLEINGDLKQKGNTSLMINPIDELIAYVSKFFTLKVGDIIFTGTPAGVGAIKIGDRLVGKIKDTIFLDFEIK